MNGYKLRGIVDFVRRQGRLPTDRWGNTLAADDLLVWFGLDKVLTRDEQSEIKHELSAIAEADAFMDQLRRSAS